MKEKLNFAENIQEKQADTPLVFKMIGYVGLYGGLGAVIVGLLGGSNCVIGLRSVAELVLPGSAVAVGGSFLISSKSAKKG